MQVIHGFNGKDTSRFVKAAGQADLFYIKDLEIPVKQVDPGVPSLIAKHTGLGFSLAAHGLGPGHSSVKLECLAEKACLTSEAPCPGH